MFSSSPMKVIFFLLTLRTVKRVTSESQTDGVKIWLVLWHKKWWVRQEMTKLSMALVRGKVRATHRGSD